MWSSNFPETFHASMNWLLVFLFGISFRIVCSNNKSIGLLGVVFQFLFYMMIFQNLYALLCSTDLGIGWSHLLGFNHNYTASFMVMLSPFVIFNERLEIFTKTISVIVVFVTLYFIGSRGALLGFVVVLLFYALRKFRTNFKRMTALFTFFSLASILFINISFDRDTGRISLVEKTIGLWSKRPVLGSGTGTWNSEVYQFGLDFTTKYGSDLNNSAVVLSHNLPSKILAELGIVGIVLWLLLYLYPLIKLFKLKKNNFYMSCFCSLLLYLLFSNMYTFCDFSKFDFSGHLLFSVLIIMIIPKKTNARA